MTAGRQRRLHRVREAMSSQGVDALLLSLGADLPWLTGYEAMPLERLTMLVLPVDADACLVIPALEAPRCEVDAGRVLAAAVVRIGGPGRHRGRPGRGAEPGWPSPTGPGPPS